MHAFIHYASNMGGEGEKEEPQKQKVVIHHMIAAWFMYQVKLAQECVIADTNTLKKAFVSQA